MLGIIPGDATNPQAAGPALIAHVCNDVGGWGKGFVLALSRRWSAPEREFRAWYRSRADNDFGLGRVQVVQCEPDIWVANMVAQRGTRAKVPIRYDALESCLTTLAAEAVQRQASVHMPRIGCGLAGGTWAEIEPIIEKTLIARKVVTTVYDFDEATQE